MHAFGVFTTLIVFSLLGCRDIKLDPSMTAFAAGDKTLVHSACLAAPGQGLDICRVVEGSPISQSWVFVVPWDSRYAASGQIRIRYRDRVTTVNIAAEQVVVSWREIIGEDVWQLDHEMPVQALGVIKYNTPDGPKWVDLLGYAFPIVLKEGYSPLPMDSGLQAFDTTCRVQYSTAGRSAISCRR